MLKICAYVPDAVSGRMRERQAKAGYDGLDITGLRVICDSLERAGYRVERAGPMDVYRYRVVLVSITAADRDWVPFIRERFKWPKGNYFVIAGGAGVMNVRPFLPFADCFVLGRGENLIVDIVKNIERNDMYVDESVIWSADFNMDTTYRFRQERPYPYPVAIHKGIFREKNIGCPRKCAYCSYSHHRESTNAERYVLDVHKLRQSYSWEHTMLDMLDDPCADLGHLSTTALDGLSERLRLMVNKPITREKFKRFLCLLASYGKGKMLKLFNIVGYPTETEDDWHEFIEDLTEADHSCEPGPTWHIQLHSTPFRALPATPAACWPMSGRDYRGQIAKTLKKISGCDRDGLIFFQGKRFTVSESFNTEGLSTTALAAVCIRGTEADTFNLTKLAADDRYEKLRGIEKLNYLDNAFNMGTLFGAFTPETLPTRNIKTYMEIEGIPYEV